MILYLDTCCFNRPFDDLSQEKIRLEAENVRNIIEMSKKGEILIASSEFVEYEIAQIKNIKKRQNVKSFYRFDEFYTINNRIAALARYYQTFGLKTFDSLHLAAAESNNVNYLLTTDDDFLKFSRRIHLNSNVISPCEFNAEVL